MTFNEESKCTLCVHFLTFISLLALCYTRYSRGFPRGSVVKNPPANAGDTGSVPGLGRFLRRNLKKEESEGGGNGNPLQHSCLENPMDREEPGGQ